MARSSVAFFCPCPFSLASLLLITLFWLDGGGIACLMWPDPVPRHPRPSRTGPCPPALGQSLRPGNWPLADPHRCPPHQLQPVVAAIARHPIENRRARQAATYSYATAESRLFGLHAMNLELGQPTARPRRPAGALGSSRLGEFRCSG